MVHMMYVLNMTEYDPKGGPDAINMFPATFPATYAPPV